MTMMPRSAAPERGQILAMALLPMVLLATRARRVMIVAVSALITTAVHPQGLPPEAAQEKARATEALTTDDERFGLLRNLITRT